MKGYELTGFDRQGETVCLYVSQAPQIIRHLNLLPVEVSHSKLRMDEAPTIHNNSGLAATLAMLLQQLDEFPLLHQPHRPAA